MRYPPGSFAQPTPEQEAAARKLLALGDRSREGIARLVGISDRQLRRIAEGKA